MAAIIYKTYDFNLTSFEAMIAELTAAYNWAKIEYDEQSETAKFYLSTGSYIEISFLENLYYNISIYRHDGVLCDLMTTVYTNKYFAFVKTKKVFAFYVSTNDTAVNSTWRGFAISNGTNAVTGDTYNDILTIIKSNEKGITCNQFDDTTNTEGTLPADVNITPTISQRENMFFAVAGHGLQSMVVADNILLSIIHPSGAATHAVTLNGKKYLQVGWYLFADE